MDTVSALAAPAAGHNSGTATVTFELKLFNSLSGAVAGGYRGVALERAAGVTIGAVLADLCIPVPEVFLVFVNGKDITRGTVAAPIRTDYCIQDGDVVALSGPVPYSWGYGSPVV